MIEKLKETVEKILKDEKSEKEFMKLKTLKEVYEKCKEFGYESDYEEFVKDYNTIVLGLSEKLSLEELESVSGGKMNKKLTKATATVLSALTLSTTAIPQSSAAGCNDSTSSKSSNSKVVNFVKKNPGTSLAALLGAAAVTTLFLDDMFTKKRQEEEKKSREEEKKKQEEEKKKQEEEKKKQEEEKKKQENHRQRQLLELEAMKEITLAKLQATKPHEQSTVSDETDLEKAANEEITIYLNDNQRLLDPQNITADNVYTALKDIYSIVEGKKLQQLKLHCFCTNFIDYIKKTCSSENGSILAHGIAMFMQKNMSKLVENANKAKANSALAFIDRMCKYLFSVEAICKTPKDDLNVITSISPNLFYRKADYLKRRLAGPKTYDLSTRFDSGDLIEFSTLPKKLFDCLQKDNITITESCDDFNLSPVTYPLKERIFVPLSEKNCIYLCPKTGNPTTLRFNFPEADGETVWSNLNEKSEDWMVRSRYYINKKSGVVVRFWNKEEPSEWYSLDDFKEIFKVLNRRYLISPEYKETDTFKSLREFLYGDDKNGALSDIQDTEVPIVTENTWSNLNAKPEHKIFGKYYYINKNFSLVARYGDLKDVASQIYTLDSFREEFKKKYGVQIAADDFEETDTFKSFKKFVYGSEDALYDEDFKKLPKPDGKNIWSNMIGEYTDEIMGRCCYYIDKESDLVLSFFWHGDTYEYRKKMSLNDLKKEFANYYADNLNYWDKTETFNSFKKFVYGDEDILSYTSDSKRLKISR